MNNTHNASCGFLKMNLAKFPAISMENDQQTSFFFLRPMSPKITLTKGKESKTRKSEGKERRRRAKSKSFALSLNHIGYFTSFLNKKKLLDPIHSLHYIFNTI